MKSPNLHYKTMSSYVDSTSIFVKSQQQLFIHMLLLQEENIYEFHATTMKYIE